MTQDIIKEVGCRLRILAFDTSMTSPGVAVIEVTKRKPTIKALSHVKTSTTHTHGLRADIVESWATLFLAKHSAKPFDYVSREDFNGRTSAQNYPVFAAWSGIQRAAEKFDVTFDMWQEPGKRATLGPTPSKVKLLVCGKGSADKAQVESAVRMYTGYTGDFVTDDESDAAAIALAVALKHGLIDVIKSEV